MTEKWREWNTLVSRKSVQLSRGGGDIVHCIEKSQQRYDGGHGCGATVAFGGREENLDIRLSGGAADRLLDTSN